MSQPYIVKLAKWSNQKLWLTPDSQPDWCSCWVLLLSGQLQHAFLQQRLPHGHGAFAINAQHLDCASSDGGSAFQNHAIPAEMITPPISSWMEQSRHFVRLRVNARNVRAFEGVAEETRQSRILESRPASMFLGDDVVNLKWHAGELRRKAAVFAATPRAAPNPRLQARVHSSYPFSARPLRESRALDWSSSKRRPASR